MSVEFVKTPCLLDLDGKVALVTGAARGIGRAIALRLADAGAALVLCDTAGAEVEAVAGEITSAGGRVVATAADVTNSTDNAQIIAAGVAAFGGIDILVNNAALRGWATWETLTEAEWDRFMAVNTKAVFFLSQAVARQMVAQGRGGAIVNIASTAAAHPVRWKVDYNTANAGVAMMTRSLAVELGPHMIRVNAVGPGGTNTAGGPGSIQSSFSPD
ncbi:MAG TPA: SDR family NAD(P)-dependent oxidoreductase, partial [Acetobacteraceae bacterium]|nr:SDR family NAD(P)-dependent oxidoreductase [Acetobacteraceae bacterium]